MSALINYQIFRSCNYVSLALRTHAHILYPPPLFLHLCTHLCLQVEPFLPYEYTCEGMLERVHAYIQNQVGLKTQISGQLIRFVMM